MAAHASVGVIPPSEPATIYAKDSTGVVYPNDNAVPLRSSDYGDNWSRLPNFPGPPEWVNPSDANELIAQGSGGIWKTFDGGAAWAKIGDHTGVLAVNRFDGNRLFVLESDAARNATLYRTTDGGASWTSSVITHKYATKIAVDPTNDNVIYLGGYDSYSDWVGPGRYITVYYCWVDKSTDGGASWTADIWRMYGPYSSIIVSGIYVDPAFPNRVYVSIYDDHYGPGGPASNGYLYRSEDYGATWKYILGGTAVDIEINPAATNEVYAAAFNEPQKPLNGVLVSTDWGNTWQPMNAGLTMTHVNSLAANWTHRILYVGTSGGGIFRTFLPSAPSMPTISGTVKTSGGAGTPGVLLSFSNGGGTVTTGSNGYYVLAVPAGWTGTVTPSKAGSAFTPANRSYTNVTANIGGEDYTEITQTHSVSDPWVPTGQPRGEKDVSYIFASGGSVCSQGHGVEYRFDWGDGSFSGWSSAAGASHSWATPGTYTVKVQARCAVDTSVLSGWSPGTAIAIQAQYTGADKHAVGDFDGDGWDEIAVDFGTQGVWLWNGGSWTLLTPSNPEHLMAGDMDGDGVCEITGDFGPDGIWTWDAGTWSRLSGQNPEVMAAADTDGDSAVELVADLGVFGVWLWNAGSWNQLYIESPDDLMAADTDGDSADEILFDFGSNGLWLWNDGSRTQITEDDPEYMIAADTDGDSAGELVVDFGSLGLWLWNGGAWTYLTNDNPEFMAAGDTDGDGADEVAVDFGGLGVYLWNGGTWSFLTPDNPDFLLAAMWTETATRRSSATSARPGFGSRQRDVDLPDGR